MTGIFFLVTFLHFITSVALLEPPGLRKPKPFTTIDSGPVYGKLQHTTDSIRPILTFLGIPYARPPIGELRFQRPQRAQQWTKTLMTKEFSDHCIQDIEQNDLFHPYVLPHNRTSEDCLYLNVYTSSLTSKSPVLVWIHGGGLVFGTGSMYDGTTLATYHDIVVVTFNYRLGGFGFLSNREKTIPGDAGFWDQHAVLRWVQRNIAKFGGDPNKVTIAGESAGSISVNLHILSPASKGLFSRAMSQSGNVQHLFHAAAMIDHVDQSKIVAKQCGCDTQSLTEMGTCLKLKSEQEILDCSRVVGFNFHPVIGGSFLPDSPSQIYAQKAFNRVDYVTSVNENEGFMTLSFLGLKPDDCKDIESFKQVLNSFFTLMSKEKFNSSMVVEKIVQLYVGETLERPSSEFLQEQMMLILRNMFYDTAAVMTARHHSAEVKNTYLYRFKHRASFSTKPGYVIADHVDELPFMFGAMFSELTAHLMKSDKDDIYVSRMMMKYLANFMETGNPNSKGLVEWPAFGEHDEYLYMCRKPTAERRYEEKYMRFWIEEFPSLLSTKTLHEEL